MASQSNQQDVELRALEREAKTDRQLLESYLAKYREASARDSINAAPPDARIISRATPAIKPAYPKKLATVLIAAFAAFALQSGFVVTGVLLTAPAGTPYGYGYGPASYAAVGYEPYEPTIVPPAPVPPPASPPPRRTASPSLAPVDTAANPPGGSAAAPPPAAPPPVASIDEIAQGLRQAGDAGRRVTVFGTGRNVGATFAAITLARTLAKDGSVVLVDMAFGAPNLSVISNDPDAPGIAELVRGEASFGDIITRDQYSGVHLVATGDVGDDAALLAASPMLATVVEALTHSYDHVVIDAGAAAEAAVDRFVPLAGSVVLVAGDAADASTRAARERLMMAGVDEVTVLQGGARAAAA
ncbi:MAG: hypothetical protein P8Y71_30045 [Pseudolabrys sp.]